MRKFVMTIASAIVMCLLFSVGTSHAADGDVRLYLNRTELQPEVPARIIEGNTLVPVRIVSEGIGADVSWNQEEQMVTIERNGMLIQLVIDQTEAVVNGVKHELEVAPLLDSGNTLLPVRFVSENLGLEVEWDPLSRAVFLFEEEEAIPVDGGTDPAPSIPAGATPSPTPRPDGDQDPSQDEEEKLPQITEIELVEDTLRIVADEGTVEPVISRLSNPERLVIDIPNAALSPTINGEPAVQNGEILLEHDFAGKIRYALFLDNPSTVRVVVDLKQKIAYTLLESENPSEISVSLKAVQYLIVLDAGHGGKDPGAISKAGRMEKDFNLAMVLKVAELLREVPFVEVSLTREDDTFVELNDRAGYANQRQADLFVSIHGNSFTDNTAISGSETYYTREESKAFADVLHKYVVEATGFIDRGVRKKELRVTKATTMPAVLLEIGYMSNPQEEQTLFSEELQNRVAESIAAGIREYLQIP